MPRPIHCPKCGSQAAREDQARCIDCLTVLNPTAVVAAAGSTDPGATVEDRGIPDERTSEEATSARPDSGAPPRTEDEALARVRARARTLFGSLGAVQWFHEQALRQQRQRLTEEKQRALELADRDHRAATARLGNVVSRTVSDVRAAMRAHPALLHPACSEDLDGVGVTTGRDIARLVRIGDLVRAAGNLHNEEVRVPLLVPLLDHANLRMSSKDEASSGTERSLIVTILTRALLGTAPGTLRLSFFNPEMRSDIAMFERLGASLRPTNEVSQERLNALLTALQDGVQSTIRLLQGNWPSIGEYYDQRPEGNVPDLHILTILDFPKGFDERSASLLATLARQGPTNGLSILLQHREDLDVPRGVDLPSLLEPLPSIASYFPIQRFQGCELRLDALDREQVFDVCERIATATETADRTAIDLRGLLPAPGLRWSESSDAGLSVPFGRIADQETTFRLNSSLPHALIGGMSGSGKSVLLKTLLLGLTLRYSPEELELYLLDFKEGVEFEPFAAPQTFFPHARTVGIEADAEIGTGTLQRLEQEVHRRSALFKAVQPAATSITEYRQRTGATLPRILLVVDEFQRLLEEGTPAGTENAKLLESVARLGRAYGIHMVLASQTISGIQALAVRGSSIFGQFPLRVALRLNETESQRILGANNRGAAELQRAGQAVLNEASGAPEANQGPIDVAMASPETFEELLRGMDRDPSRPPLAFRRGRLVAPMELLAAVSQHRGGHGVAAESSDLPVGIGLDLLPTSVVLESHVPASHLAVIGAPSSEAIGVLHAVAMGLSTDRPTTRFVIIDPGGQNSQEFDVDGLTAALGTRGHQVERLPVDESLEQRLTDVVESAAGSTSGAPSPTVVIGAELDLLRDVPRAAMSATEGNALQRLVANGHLAEVHLVGWWRTQAAAEQQLGSGWSERLVAEKVLLSGLPIGDARRLTGQLAMQQWDLPAGRAVLVETSRPQPRPFIPMRPCANDDWGQWTVVPR